MAIEDLLLLPAQKDNRFLPRPDGIFDFVAGSAAPASGALCPETLAYQLKYQSWDGARAYNTRYEERKGRTTRRESAVLQKFLSRWPDSETVLDVPCGSGRLSHAIGAFTHTLIEMDISPGQISYGRRYGRTGTPQLWVRASALQIPLKDNSVDGAVCIRLSHHLYTQEEKEKLLSELLRVSKRFVIFYFVDGESIKNTLRRWRDRLTGASRKINWMTRREVEEIVQRSGGRVTACPASGLFQPHRYALIEKYSPDSAYFQQ